MDGNVNIQELGGIERADVYKDQRLAATLTRTSDGVRFNYTPEYIADGKYPIAHTLPISEAPYITAAGGVPAFFAGLLPEGRRLLALVRAVKTSADDELSHLMAVGRDAVGDVQVVPAGEVPTPAEAPAETPVTAPAQ